MDYTAEGGVWDKSCWQWVWRDLRGHLHRVDGPAVIDAAGSQWWFLHGLRHRVDGPAYISATGHQEWWVHDQRHRVDGPAVTNVAGCEWWYVQGCDITQEVTAWLHDNNMAPPFNEEQRMEFALRWL